MDAGRPCTVTEALDAYAADLKARGGHPANAAHLSPTLASKTCRYCIDLARACSGWGDSLATKIKSATVNRLFKGLKAALNLAATHDTSVG